MIFRLWRLEDGSVDEPWDARPRARRPAGSPTAAGTESA